MAITDDEFLLTGHAYVKGRASGILVASNLELSFWGGVNPLTGEIIDRHHDLSGKHLRGAVLAIPAGRGSCSGSTAMLELILNGMCPNAILFERREDILTLGVMIAEEIFGKNLPVITLGPAKFKEILKQNGRLVYVQDGNISSKELPEPLSVESRDDDLRCGVQLSSLDHSILQGAYGEASKVSMRIILRMAELLGAQELMDVTQVHVDGCVYTGPGSLAFAERLRDLGGEVRVPTTLNSISVDQKRWRKLGVDPKPGEAAEKLGKAYTDMGARPTFTCAPYLLDSAPKLGEQVAWAESNAVVYANSVLGARTMKYPDFLDISIALTGRAPKGGPHVEENRKACLIVKLGFPLTSVDDAFYPLLGYQVGILSGNRIPAVVGIDSLKPSNDDLKSFGASFATTSSAPMFHIVGVTPEAPDLDAVIDEGQNLPHFQVSLDDLVGCWDKLNSAIKNPQPVDLVSLGNPHFSFAEVRKFAKLCRGQVKNKDVSVVITCGRSTHSLASQAGLITELEGFGVRFLNDTCWCMIDEPIVSRATSNSIMTNSGKYSHYGPGITGRHFYFDSLAGCAAVAIRGGHGGSRPLWLR
ncbi:unnamed protein product [Clonostachys byssicola]|uniref:DUF521 domain protein n=1 Tax=Clonostachys byssicola TaxID=160290 RepID=A0A9N9U0W0_9HYPO|nr:unnamed protein product [Clonostachys byssicola]